MRNAGIVIYNQSKLPGILSVFNTPTIGDKIKAEAGEETYNLFLIHYPPDADNLFRKRNSKILAKLCQDHEIDFILEGRRIRCLTQSGEFREAADGAQGAEEVRAVKELGALVKLSVDYDTNLLSANIGFVTQSPDMHKIDLLSEEAVSVMIYESDKPDSNLNSVLKEQIYSEFMNKKGISIVFTKDMEALIKNCEILIADESVDLAPYADHLRHKVILGRNDISGDFIKIEKILLWSQDLTCISDENEYIRYNDEILTIIRFFNQELTAVEFIKMFPYIYLINRQNKPLLALDIGK